MNYKEYAKNLVGKKGRLERKEGGWKFETVTPSPNVTLTEVEDDFAIFLDDLKLRRSVPLGSLSLISRGEKASAEKA